MKYYTTIIFTLLVSSVFAFETYYFTVSAKSGDGVYSILRRYHLNEHQCNRQHFLKLNGLSISDNLVQGKEYKLPIHIYKYNGTSIRSTVGIESWEQAVRIQKYNDKILQANLRKTKYSESKILWVPHHEIDCDIEDSIITSSNEKIPSKSKTVKDKKSDKLTVDLFGPEHNEITVEDKILKGKVYYIVSGHGGPDPGAMCNCSNTLCEDEYAYDVCLRLTRELMKHGATVHMIIQDKDDGIRDDKVLECDKDEFCMGAKIPYKQKKRLKQRADAINDLYKKYTKEGIKDQVAIMVHVDSNVEDKRQDVFFYHHKSSKSSKHLATELQKTFKAKYDYFQKGRGYKGYVRERGLYMLNNTLPTSAYVELANIRNPHDHKRLLMNDNREALAKWLCEGIASSQSITLN